MGRPTTYQSEKRGKEEIDSMNATHAARAAKLVRRGDRPGGIPVARALEAQARRPIAKSETG